MKVLSWVLTVLSFLAIPIVFVAFSITKTSIGWLKVMIIGAAICCILGYVGHILAAKYRRNNGGGCMFPYIVTFPAYIVPFILIGAIWLLLSLINFMCYAFTDRYLLSEFLDWLIRECLGIGGGRSNKNGGTNETVYVVYDGGFERRLKLYEAYKQDYDDPSLHYDRFIDDLGNYWRSYDKGETFRKETLKEKGRGY